MMTPFPPKLIAARHCEHCADSRVRARGIAAFRAFRVSPHGRACARAGVNFVNFRGNRGAEAASAARSPFPRPS